MSNNDKKTEKLNRLIDETLSSVLRKGFHGMVSFNILIQDGAIQEIQKVESSKHRY